MTDWNYTAKLPGANVWRQHYSESKHDCANLPPNWDGGLPNGLATWQPP